MNYPPDPAGVFASDVHRRVMANVPNPADPYVDITDLVEQVNRDEHLRVGVAGVNPGQDVDVWDEYLNVDMGELDNVLKDLEADGHVKHTQSGWRSTAAGWEALTNEKANREAGG